MLAGYAFVDALVAAGIDVFALGQRQASAGAEHARAVRDGAKRAARPTPATWRPLSGASTKSGMAAIQDVVEWYARHADESAWSRAAGVYVRMLSKPQLFIEGNHRTGALVMSYILLASGQPPFVLSVENAAAYFEPSTASGTSTSTAPPRCSACRGIRRRLAALLREHADRRYLLD